MISVEQFAAMYDVDPATVRKWIRRGLLPAFRVGRVTRIAEEDEENFRRLHTWRGANGRPARSADEPSPAKARPTATGEASYLRALTRVDLSSSRATDAKSKPGSIVGFPSKESA